MDDRRRCPTFPSSRASPPRATRTLRGGRMKTGGSLSWELHPVTDTITFEMEEGAEANRVSLIMLSETQRKEVEDSLVIRETKKMIC